MLTVVLLIIISTPTGISITGHEAGLTALETNVWPHGGRTADARYILREFMPVVGVIPHTYGYNLNIDDHDNVHLWARCFWIDWHQTGIGDTASHEFFIEGDYTFGPINQYDSDGFIALTQADLNTYTFEHRNVGITFMDCMQGATIIYHCRATATHLGPLPEVHTMECWIYITLI